MVYVEGYAAVIAHFDTEIEPSLAVDIDSREKRLQSVALVTDMFNLRLVIVVNLFHRTVYASCVIPVQRIEAHRYRRRFPFRNLRLQVVHNAYRELPGVIGIPHVESVEAAVGGDNRQIGFCLKVAHGSFQSHDVGRSCGFVGDDIRRTEVHVLHGGRENQVRGLVERHFDLTGCYLRLRYLGLPAATCAEAEQKDDVSFHGYFSILLFRDKKKRVSRFERYSHFAQFGREVLRASREERTGKV